MSGVWRARAGQQQGHAPAEQSRITSPTRDSFIDSHPHTPLSLTVRGPRRSYKAEKPPHFCLDALREGRASSDGIRPQARTGRISGQTRLEERTLSAKERISPARREAPRVQALGLGTEGPRQMSSEVRSVCLTRD